MPEKWTPPSYATPADSRSGLKKTYDAATTPLTTKPREWADKLANLIDDPTKREENWFPELSAFLAGSVQGLGDVTSQMTSPLDLAATLTGVGAIKAGAKGFTQAASGLRRITQGLSAPIAAHGAGTVLSPESTWSERGMGVAELAGGAAGMHFPVAPTSSVPRVNPALLGSGTTYISGNRGVADVRLGPYNKQGGDVVYSDPFAPPSNVIDGQIIGGSRAGVGLTDVRHPPPRMIDVSSRPTVESVAIKEFEDMARKRLEAIVNRPAEPIRDGVSEVAPGSPFADIEPQFSKVRGNDLADETVGLTADVPMLGKILGTSLYKGDITPVATKELMQNSIDAIRHLGETGEIKVHINRGDKFIEVTDNGKGMTPDDVKKYYLKLAGSGKRDDMNAAGGFGIAKASFLLGGERSKFASIAKDPRTGDLIETTFEATPDEVLNKKVIMRKKIAPEDAKTGTSIRVYVPEKSDFYEASNFVKTLSTGSTNLKGSIKFSNTFGKGFEPSEEDYAILARGSGKSLTKLKNSSGNAELIIPDDATTTSRSFVELQLLNNGMYQGTKTIFFNDSVPNIPSKITVNIESKVPEGHADYPFTANREDLRGTIDELVKKYIDDNIVKPAFGKKTDELTRLYAGMQEVQIGSGDFPNIFGKKISAYDPKGQLTSEKIKDIFLIKGFAKLADEITELIDEVVGIVDNAVWSERLEKTGIIFSDEVHGIHIPNPASKKSAILINPLVAIRDMTPDETVNSIMHTIQHEIAHIEPGRPGHNEDFTIRLGQVIRKQGWKHEHAGKVRLYAALTDESGGYHPDIQEVLQRYTESRGNPASTEDLLTGTGIKSEAPRGGKGDLSGGSGSSGKGTESTAKQLRDEAKRLGIDASNYASKHSLEQAIRKKRASETVATPTTKGTKGAKKPKKFKPGSRVADKLLRNLKEAAVTRTEQEEIYRVERARRFAAFGSVKAEGVKGARQQLSKLSGEYEKLDVDRLKMSESDVDSLFTAVKQAKIMPGEKARAYTGLFKILDGGHVPQRNELAILDEVFGGGFTDSIMELQGGFGAVKINIAKTANTMKAMMSSVDVSGPMRQGIGLIHRKEWRDSFVEMFKYLGDKEYYEAAMDTLTNRPTYMLGRESGLFLSKPKDVTQAEEAFLNSYVHNLPVIRNIVGASERAYTGFLNKLRADTFDNLVNQSQAAGQPAFTVVRKEVDGEMVSTVVPSKVAEDLAKYINNATGRGSLGRLEKVAPELNIVIWSPRLISSRLNTFNPKFYADMEPIARKEAVKSLFAIAAAGTTLMSLGALAGGQLNSNPLSSDFGKVRFGTKVLDPWAGHQQILVAASRMISWSNETGPQNPATTAGRLGVSKLSPAASLAYDIGSAQKLEPKGMMDPGRRGEFEDRFGNKTTVQKEVLDRFVPIFLQDVRDTIEEDPEFAELVGLSVPAFFGVGVQDYPERRTSRQSNVGIRRMSLTP